MPIPDPLVALAYAAAVTKTLRLATGIVILPQRHPLYVAKEVATLDVLSHGRVIFGIGVGWLEEEFQALGVPFDERAARTAEAVRAIRSLWKDEAEPFHGRFYRWEKLESHPKPVQKPGVLIVVGGHTELAARRAARYGDGFFRASPRRRSWSGCSASCATNARSSAAIRRRSRSRPDARSPMRTGSNDSEDLGVSRFIGAAAGIRSGTASRRASSASGT
mgnify:CR=1 FL=1